MTDRKPGNPGVTRENLAENPGVTRKLRALWALHCIGGIDDAGLAKLLDHSSEYLRAWAVRLFVALCRRYGFRPYRYPRQRRTTLMVRAPRRFVEAVVWRQFSELQVAPFSWVQRCLD